MLFKVGVQAILIFWVKDVGDEPPDGMVPGGFSTQGSHMYYWEVYPEYTERKLGVLTFGYGNTVGGV